MSSFTEKGSGWRSVRIQSTTPSCLGLLKMVLLPSCQLPHVFIKSMTTILNRYLNSESKNSVLHLISFLWTCTCFIAVNFTNWNKTKWKVFYCLTSPEAQMRWQWWNDILINVKLRYFVNVFSSHSTFFTTSQVETTCLTSNVTALVTNETYLQVPSLGIYEEKHLILSFAYKINFPELKK